MLAFLAGSEKTPAEMDRAVLISFEDDSKNVLLVEKKLQAECFVVDLIGLSSGEFRNFHGVGDSYSGLRGGFKRNPFHGP